MKECTNYVKIEKEEDGRIALYLRTNFSDLVGDEPCYFPMRVSDAKRLGIVLAEKAAEAEGERLCYEFVNSSSDR